MEPIFICRLSPSKLHGLSIKTECHNKTGPTQNCHLFSMYSSVILLRGIGKYTTWAEVEGPCVCCQKNNRFKSWLVLQRKEKQPGLTLICLQGKFSTNLIWSKCFSICNVRIGIYSLCWCKFIELQARSLSPQANWPSTSKPGRTKYLLT